MSVQLLVLQPSEIDPPGRLGDWLTDAGATLHVMQPTEGVPGLDEFDGVVCLGGEMGAHDDAEYPWLADVRTLLATAVARTLPVLGVCLGGQLLAAATGGLVRRADSPEIGAGLVAKRDAAAGDPLFEPLPLTPDVIQFHHDEIHRLPAGATLLAASPRQENQAFRIGSAGYGMQFHIETDTETVLSWARRDPEAAATAPPRRLDRDQLERQHAELAEVWAPAAQRFVQLAAGELAPAIDPVVAGDRTTLPLAGQ